MTRSLVHMLHVLAVRLEIDHGPKDAVKALQLFAKDRTIRQAEHRNWNAEQEKRAERQRTLFAMLPSSNATDRLKEAMLQRAYDLLWDGDTMGCDALTEFLPSSEVDAMMTAWGDDFDSDEAQKSRWYKGEIA